VKPFYLSNRSTFQTQLAPLHQGDETAVGGINGNDEAAVAAVEAAAEAEEEARAAAGLYTLPNPNPVDHPQLVKAPGFKPSSL
jgi:hypothetical protein